MAVNRRVSTTLSELRKIYRAGERGLHVALTALVPGTPKRKRSNKPKRKKNSARQRATHKRRRLEASGKRVSRAKNKPRKLKFGSAAWRKKYMKKKNRSRR
jgi:hypothetical protein